MRDWQGPNEIPATEIIYLFICLFVSSSYCLSCGPIWFITDRMGKVENVKPQLRQHQEILGNKM